MGGNTAVYRVVYNDGENHTVLVFSEPVEGKPYQAGEMFNLDSGDWALTNDEGDIPHREPSGEPGENLGVTWHFQK